MHLIVEKPERETRIWILQNECWNSVETIESFSNSRDYEKYRKKYLTWHENDKIYSEIIYVLCNKSIFDLVYTLLSR